MVARRHNGNTYQEIAVVAAQPLPVVTGFEIPPHNRIDFSYTGTDLTGVTYKLGGANGVTVATVTLAYSNGNLTSVEMVS